MLGSVSANFPSPAGALNIRLVATEVSKTTTRVLVNYKLYIERASGTGFFNGSGTSNSWSITTGTPTPGSGSNFTFDFRGGPGSVLISDIDRNIAVSGTETRVMSASATIVTQTTPTRQTRTATTASRTITLTPTPAASPVSWVTTSLNEIARVDSEISIQLSATNATATGYSLASGTLPGGITLSTGGLLSGTATAGTSQTFSFVVRAVNSDGAGVNSNTFNLVRRQPLPVWTDNTLNTTSLRVGNSYSDSVAATGASSYTSNGLSGTGLSFSSATRTVSGEPLSTSSFSFSISAANSDSEEISASFTFTPKPRLPVFTDAGLATTTAKINRRYTEQVVASSAVGYALSSGAFPPGISIIDSTGEIEGTPTALGTYNFQIAARNSINETTNTPTLTLTVEPAGAGQIWNGTAWVQAPFQVWSATGPSGPGITYPRWLEAPVRVWDGTTWADPTV